MKAPVLTEADHLAIARQLAPLLADVLRDSESRPALLTTGEAADELRVKPDWVRRHKVQLGAVHLGKGDKPHLRFPRESIDAYIAARAAPAGRVAPEPSVRGRRRDRHVTETPTLAAAGTPVLEW